MAPQHATGRIAQWPRTSITLAPKSANTHKLGYSDFDAAALKSAEPRELTQRVAKFLYAHAGDDGRLLFDGVRFASRHGDELMMWAVFERPGDDPISRRLSQQRLTRSSTMTKTSCAPSSFTVCAGRINSRRSRFNVKAGVRGLNPTRAEVPVSCHQIPRPDRCGTSPMDDAVNGQSPALLALKCESLEVRWETVASTRLAW